MTINVSAAINSDTSEKIKIERYSGEYVDGIYVKNDTPTVIKTIASVQQPTPKQLESLTSGERDSDIMTFISKKPIYSVKDRDGDPADVVLRKGLRYKIISSADWDTFGHTIAMGARVV